MDATTLPHLYPTGDNQQHNLLIIWSIFFVAANVKPDYSPVQSCNLTNANLVCFTRNLETGGLFIQERYEGLHVFPCKGQKYKIAVKVLTLTINYQCLHYNGGETDHTVLLQSALLLGFYHSGADSHTQPWYWLGVAISLCQSIGLHRCSSAECATSPIPKQQQRLWRRLWWTCVFRDRWLSLTMGRPLRINMNDCNTMMPSADDMLSDFVELPESMSAAYIPRDLPQLADYWVTMVHLTQLLGETLTLSYQPFGPSPSFQQVEDLERKILLFQLPQSHDTVSSPLATFYLYHLQLHYQ